MLGRRTGTKRRAKRNACLVLLGLLCLLGGCAYTFDAVNTPPGKPRAPARSIAAKRAKRTWRVSARPAHTHRGPGESFQCSPDGSRSEPCEGATRHPVSFAGGGHTFQASTPDSPGRHAHSPPGSSGPRVVPQPSGERFSIVDGGIAGGLLYPGAAPQAIRLTLSNPNGISIFVTSLTVTVPSGPAGCDSATNLILAQSSVSSAAPVEIQAHGSVTLPAQGRSAPAIGLMDLPVNQDSCQNARFPLSFTGSAHS